MYCTTSTNPDVTGIGVRLSMYIQSFLTVVLGYISWSRNRDSTPAILSAARLQTYTLAAFSIATLTATIKNQMSLFHQYAAVQLAILTYASGVFAAMFWAFRNVKWMTVTWWLIACGIAIVTFLILLLWSEVDPGCSLVSSSCSSTVPVCDPSPGSPDVGYDQLTWVFLFGVHLTGRFAFLAIPFATVSGGILILGAFYYGPVKLLLLGFLLFFTQSVVGIERSLKANSIDLGLENAWSFGQIIPIFLLVPTLESILAEWYRFDASEGHIMLSSSPTSDKDESGDTEGAELDAQLPLFTPRGGAIEARRPWWKSVLPRRHHHRRSSRGVPSGSKISWLPPVNTVVPRLASLEGDMDGVSGKYSFHLGET